MTRKKIRFNELCRCDFDAHGSSGKEAGTAVNGAHLGGIERNRSLLSALGALDRNFDALSYSRRLRGRDRSQSFVFCLFAGFAAFGFVFESLVVKENLLAGSTAKVFVTIHTTD